MPDPKLQGTVQGPPQDLLFTTPYSLTPTQPGTPEGSATYNYTPSTPDYFSSASTSPLLPNRPVFIADKTVMKREPKVRYLSLNEAVYDNSQPDFDPRFLDHNEALGPTSYSGFSKSLPSPALYPGGLPKPPKRHPFAKGFEAPEWTNILIYIILCLVTYPLLMIFIIIARRKPLFWTRFIVSMGCGILGFLLGVSLLGLGKRFLEAATWATVIHQSRVDGAPGVKLKDLAANSGDPTSAYPALHLLWDRFMYTGTSRRSRAQYDRRPWSLFILFFLLLVVIAGSLPFVLGRLVGISTTVIVQHEHYEEIAIKGVNSDSEIARATILKPSFEDFTLTWTLSPFSTHGGLPPVVKFDWKGDTVYFAETVLSQLLPNGGGLGTFETEKSDRPVSLNTPTSKTSDAAKDIDPGATLRYARWGTRLHCAKLPNPELNLVPRSLNTFTYFFTPRDTLRSLFSSFDLDLPPLSPNLTRILQKNDTLPTGINADDLGAAGALYDNGVGHSFISQPLPDANGKGWISIEHVVVRLNTSYTPNGKFPRRSELSVPDVKGNPTWIGYDAAVCVQLFEPWVLETYNSTTGFPTSVRIVEPGNEVHSINTAVMEESMFGSPISDSNVSRQLNSSKLDDVYNVGHTNSINQILKDNGRDAYYVPSPTLISFTDGQGPAGYTELSPTFFAQARGQADASNVLPYFSGTGDLVARRYPDRVLSSAWINPVYMIIYLGLILVVGLVAGFFVPKLPLDVPHRGFELYSWMAAFHADELVGERTNMGIARNMELNDIEHQMGELRFRYVNHHTSG